MKISEGWMVVVVGAGFVLAPLFLELAVCFRSTGAWDYTPSKAQILASVFTGLGAGINSFLAFINRRVGDYEQKRNGGAK